MLDHHKILHMLRQLRCRGIRKILWWKYSCIYIFRRMECCITFWSEICRLFWETVVMLTCRRRHKGSVTWLTMAGQRPQSRYMLYDGTHSGFTFDLCLPGYLGYFRQCKQWRNMCGPCLNKGNPLNLSFRKAPQYLFSSYWNRLTNSGVISDSQANTGDF